MSFSEFMFLAGFTQKTAKEDLNIKRDHGIIRGYYAGMF